jgi:predicted CXXCH cytochrome family protein
MTGSTAFRLAALLIVAAAGPVAIGFGAGDPYKDVEQTVHNIMPPSSVYTLNELCIACHVDGNIRVPGVPLPPEEAALPGFATEREQRPLWNQGTPVKNYALPQNWPLPQPMLADQPFGASADCLGCHDGAFAEDVHRGGERRGRAGIRAVNDFFDRMETALGGTLERKNEIPDHPVSTIYPKRPDGEMLARESVASQRRFFAIPDLQDEQLVLPTGITSKFYAQTPGNLLAPSVLGNGNGNGHAVEPAPAGAASTAESVEQFRLIHTTFGVIHCDSCHNAHSELHTGFLRDKSPQLCLLCHDR